jgi:hypothetical protein
MIIWIIDSAQPQSVDSREEDGVDPVSEVCLVILEPGDGDVLLLLDQRGNALELEPGVHPPRVHRVMPHGLVPDAGP